MKAILVLAVTFVAFPFSLAQAALPELNALSGRWSGPAEIAFADGKSVDARCVATYFIRGSAVEQNVRCTNPDFTVRLQSNLAVSGARLQGTWTEESFNQSGGLNGSIDGNILKLQISGSLSGRMVVNTNGRSQNVAIHFENAPVKKIAIQMRK